MKDQSVLIQMHGHCALKLIWSQVQHTHIAINSEARAMKWQRRRDDGKTRATSTPQVLE